MLSYNDLTKAQKKWVDLVELVMPKMNKEYLSYDDILKIHENFTVLRSSNKNFKCSKALWLISNNSVSRGKYKFPSSTSGDLKPDVEPVATEIEILYRAELKKFGI